MGMFANTLFSVLLGWVQTAASWLWSLVTNTSVSAWLRWLLDYWLALVILLCLAGAVVDFAVYFFRWQPYRVWGKFLRRKKVGEEPVHQETPHQPMLQRTWMYADGTTHVEDVPVPQPLQHQDSDRLEAPIRPVRRVVQRVAPEQAYHQPVYPPQWQQNQQGDNE